MLFLPPQLISEDHVMRKSIVAACRVVLLLATATFPGIAQTMSETVAQPARPQFPDHKILYTGNIDGLLGSWRGCVPGGPACSPLTSSQRNQLSKFKGSSAILIGMGDNFGPDFNPGLYQPANVSGMRVNPVPGATRSVFLLDHSVYDAVVPGKEDFVFGVEFLRAAGDSSAANHVNLIANNLTVQQKPPSTCHSYPTPTPSLPILPNQISSSLSNGSASSGASGGGSGGGGGKGKGKGGGGGSSAGAGTAAAGGGSGAGASAGSSGGCDADAGQGGTAQSNKAQSAEKPTLVWPDAKSIYPWTTKMVFSVPADPKGAYPAQPDGWVCPGDWNENKTPVNPTCVQWALPPAPPAGALTLESFAPAASTLGYSAPNANVPVSNEGMISLTKVSGELIPGSSVKFCAMKKDGKTAGCTDPLMVQSPLFPRAWIWITHEGAASEDYVIFGVLASDTLNGLSQVNQEWDPAKKSDPTPQIATPEAGSAVSQALLAFNTLHKHSRALGVLLAQMSPGEAKQLADYLGSNEYAPKDATRIDVVFSAADPVEASPDISVDLSRKRARQGYYIPVMTPAPLFKQSDCLADGITKCVASLSVTNNGTTFSNRPAEEILDDVADDDPSPWDTPFCSNPEGLGHSASKQSWECHILEAMLKATYADLPSLHTDIALLEEKDFDYARGGFVRASPDTEPSPEQGLQILWNAGNLARVSLLGSTLTAILQQNQALQSTSFQTLPSIRKQQRLKILGISQASGTYYINGMQITPTEVYSVITSDNLAVSTSDYPLLAQQDQNLPEVFWTNGKPAETAGIASIGASIVGGHNPSPYFVNQSTLEAHVSNSGIPPWQASTSAASSKPTPPTWTYSNRTLPNVATLSKLERIPETRPLWNLSLQQLAFSYSLSDPNQADQNIGSNLGGVTNPNVATPHSDSISFTEDVRMAYYPKRDKCPFCIGDVGLDSQVNFTRSRQGSTAAATPTVTTTGQTVPEESITYPGNTYIWSPFIEFQTSKVSLWKPIVIRPPLFTTNIVPLPQYLASATKGTDFLLSQRQTTSLGFNIGSRFEKNDFNYFEAGLSDQLSFNVLSALAVAGQTACPLTGQSTLSTCASGFTPSPDALLFPTYNTYNQRGGYWLGMLTEPFSVTHSALFLYQGTAFGNFFAYGKDSGSTTLSHYAVEVTNTLQVSLPSNFSIGPTYNLFFYQANARHVIGSSLTRQNVGFQFNYSFNWHNGLSLKDAMTGKNQ